MALDYTVRRSPRARRVRLLVDGEAVEVVAPAAMDARTIERFVASKEGWVERVIERHRAAAAIAPLPRLEDGGEIPLLDERLVLRILTGGGRLHVARSGDELRMTLPDRSPERIGEALEEWYRGQARVDVAARLDAATARAGSVYERLQIRGQRTRWASCSSSGTMSFNWRLMLVPELVLDYVVEHEVAHLDVHDHSPRFWALVEARCPGYRAPRDWLRENGRVLLGFRR